MQHQKISFPGFRRFLPRRGTTRRGATTHLGGKDQALLQAASLNPALLPSDVTTTSRNYTYEETAQGARHAPRRGGAHPGRPEAHSLSDSGETRRLTVSAKQHD